MNRRRFLKQTAIGTAVVAFPAVSRAGGVLGANDRVRLGFMGVGGRARSLLNGFTALDDVHVPIVCDVDRRRIPAAVKRVADTQNGAEPRITGDFRDILDDRDVDGLVVGTPDHWHALGTIHACQAGKDVYVEKPISHNVREGQLMIAAARRNERVVQVGIQSRSSPHHAEAYEYIRSGKLGKVAFVRAWESSRQRSLGFPADERVPAGVDYDTWLGPAPERPYNPLRFHGNWRWFFDYGTGDLGNDGVHRLDFAIRGLNAGRVGQKLDPVSFPTAVAASGGKYVFDDAQEWPDTLYATYDFPGATLVYELRIWSRYPLEGYGEGAAIHGENGYVLIGNRGWRAFGPGGEPTGDGGASDNSVHDPAHKKNFVKCIRSRARPACDIEVGHVASVLCHLGNAAWRVGRKLRFDGATQTIVDDVEANRYLTRSYRKKWSIPPV